MCVAGSFALLFGSCKKNEEVKEVTINLPAFEEEVDARAYIDFANGRTFNWNANDEVVIYNLDNTDGTQSEKAIFATDASAAGRTMAVFTNTGANLSAKKYGYFVFYPVSKVSDGALDADNRETFTVADTQNYTIDLNGTPTVDPESMALACELSSLEEGFTLQHIFGTMRIRMNTTQPNTVVTSIVVEDKHYNLSGTVSMKLHEVKMQSFQDLQNMFVGYDDPESEPTYYGAWDAYRTLLGYSAQGAGKTITLDCGEGVELSTDQPTQFMISLRPGALKYGYKIYVYVDGVDEPYVFENDANWHYGIKAGYNKNMVLDI